jgi:hypothetical protein
MHIISLLSTLLVLVPLALSQTIGSCHPYPGAVAQDCLKLIGNSLNNDTEVPCGVNGRATITLGACSITTVNPNCSGTKPIVDDVVRRALTVIGSCALSDRGSISGYYVAADNVKTCYLYPGR